MIEISTTIKSLEQAEALLKAGVNKLLFGEDQFGLRLGQSFNRIEQEQLVKLAHTYDAKVCVMVNSLMHNQQMEAIPDYLAFLKKIGVDEIMAGDPGVFQVMKQPEYALPYIYDAQTMVVSARQINFWAKRGAVGGMLAHEVPYEELVKLTPALEVPATFLVYGAACIHQSRRPLIQNYLNYVKTDESVGKERGLFISEPRKKDTQYSIYEDVNGTHIFANHDVNLMGYMDRLSAINITSWKLDGLFVSESAFVAITELFVGVKKLLEKGELTEQHLVEFDSQLQVLHPQERSIDTGFFLMDPEEVK